MPPWTLSPGSACRTIFSPSGRIRAVPILYVTHDLTEAITLADRVVLMSARPGRVVREYPIDLPRPRRVMDVKFSPRFVELEPGHLAGAGGPAPQEEGRR